MNKLLPDINEIIPIKNNNSIFYNCGYNQTFEFLSFEKKLQIINDIIRQTMIPEPFPDTNDHVENLVGNCHTAALASIQYLKKLNIGKNHKYALARGKNYDPLNINTTHAVVLVEDDLENTYLFDASPFVGYNYGKVVNIKKEKIYEEFVILNNNMINIVNRIWEIPFLEKNEQINSNNYKIFLEFLEKYYDIKILHGLISKNLKLLSKYCTYDYEKNTLIKKSQEINTCDKKTLVYKQAVKNRIKQYESEIKSINEFNKRKLDLIQYKANESLILNSEKTLYSVINDKKIKLSYITPRLLYENNMSSILFHKSFFNELKNMIIGDNECGYIINEFGQILESKNCMLINNNLITDKIKNNAYIIDDACQSVYYFLKNYSEYNMMNEFVYPNPKFYIKK